MGFWGYGIEESDEALDWEQELYQIAGIDNKAERFDPENADVRRHLERNLGKLFDDIEQGARLRTSAYGDALGYQMLAVLLMRAGCAMSESERATLRQGIVSSPEYQFAERLANESPQKRVTHAAVEHAAIKLFATTGGTEGMTERLNGRRDAINTLLATLARYPIHAGTPTDIQAEGLVDSLTLRGVVARTKERHQPHGSKV